MRDLAGVTLSADQEAALAHVKQELADLALGDQAKGEMLAEAMLLLTDVARLDAWLRENSLRPFRDSAAVTEQPGHVCATVTWFRSQ